MEQRKGFTLIELLVVIAIIALLMSILMPALTRVKDQAKNSVCMSNLHQFAIVWKMYLDENKNKFPENNEDWVFFTESLWKDENLLLCPYASKLKIPATRDDIRGGPHHAWSDSYNGRRVICSYGLNQYCSSDAAGGRDWNELIPNATIAQASRVPLMLDSSRYANTPQEHDIPPEWDGQIYTSNPSDVDEIRGFCINRHTTLWTYFSLIGVSDGSGSRNFGFSSGKRTGICLLNRCLNGPRGWPHCVILYNPNRYIRLGSMQS